MVWGAARHALRSMLLQAQGTTFGPMSVCGVQEAL